VPQRNLISNKQDEDVDVKDMCVQKKNFFWDWIMIQLLNNIGFFCVFLIVVDSKEMIIHDSQLVLSFMELCIYETLKLQLHVVLHFL
jgi:hypothetical protein